MALRVPPLLLLFACPLLLCVLLGGCRGDPPRAPDLSQGSHWPPASELAALNIGLNSVRGGWGMGYSPTFLPDAHHAVLERPYLRPRPPLRFVFILFDKGVINFREYEISLRDADEDMHDEAIEALQDALRSMYQDYLSALHPPPGPATASSATESRFPSGGWSARAGLNFHRDESWAHAAALLRAICTDGIALFDVELFVRSHRDRPLRFMALDVRPLVPSGADAGAPAPLVVQVSGPEESDAGVRIEYAGISVRFPASEQSLELDRDGYAVLSKREPSAGWLSQANACWDELESALDTSHGSPYATVHIEGGDTVSWAHVVKVLDLLKGAGVEEVDFPESSLMLRFRPASPVADPEPEPLVDGVALLWILGAIALGLLAGRAAPRRRRSSPKVGQDSGE